MGPPRNSRQTPQESSTVPPNSTSSGRHIHTKEKDILHKTAGPTGISKSKRTPTITTTPLKTSTPTYQSSSNFHNDTRSTIPPTTNNSRPTWTAEHSDSGRRACPLHCPQSLDTNVQQIKWSTMSLSSLNTWRMYYRLPMSAPFSSEAAHISLCNPDLLGSQSASMRVSPDRQPSARREVERAVAETFEEAVIDEDDVIVNFLAKREDRRGLERIGTAPDGGGGNVFGTGGSNVRPVRCRSDMLN